MIVVDLSYWLVKGGTVAPTRRYADAGGWRWVQQNGIRFEICDREFLRVFLGDRTRFFFIVRVKLVKPHNSLESHVARTRFWSVHVDICDQI